MVRNFREFTKYPNRIGKFENLRIAFAYRILFILLNKFYVFHTKNVIRLIISHLFRTVTFGFPFFPHLRHIKICDFLYSVPTT